MSDSSSGYVADIGYTYGYYQELNPERVKLAFLNAGMVAPEFGTAGREQVSRSNVYQPTCTPQLLCAHGTAQTSILLKLALLKKYQLLLVLIHISMTKRLTSLLSAICLHLGSDQSSDNTAIEEVFGLPKPEMQGLSVLWVF